MKNNKNKKKGFTLIEMLAAVVILGILAAIATVAINSILKSSRTRTLVGTYDNAVTAVKAAVLLSETPTTSDINYNSTNYTITIDSTSCTNGTFVQVAAASHNTNVTASTNCPSGAVCGDSKIASCIDSNGSVTAATAVQ